MDKIKQGEEMASRTMLKKQNSQNLFISSFLQWGPVAISFFTFAGIGLYWVMLQSTQTLQDLAVVPRFSPFFILFFLLLTGMAIIGILKTKGRRRLFLIALTIVNVSFLGFLIFMYQVLGKSGS